MARTALKRRFCAAAAVALTLAAVLRAAVVAAPLAPETGAEHRTELYAVHEGGKRLAAWDDFHAANLRAISDEALRPVSRVVPIGAAHGNGLLHRGVWVAVLRGEGAAREVLLLRRGPELKTCPGAWGLVGEHSNAGEPWADTARRALREELQVFDVEPFPLLNGSVLVQCDYPDVGRRDLQATGIFAAQLPAGAQLHFDAEVADVDWVRWTEFAAVATPARFCNEEIAALGRLVGDRLAAVLR